MNKASGISEPGKEKQSDHFDTDQKPESNLDRFMADLKDQIEALQS